MKTTIAILLALMAGTVAAQNPPPPAPCSGPEYRQMDFWLGEWDVYTPKGQLAGNSRIEHMLGDCVVFENWEGTGGSKGHSFNLYNFRSGEWEQTWVDNGGGVIYFHGKWDPEASHLDYRANSTGSDGSPILYRMVFTPQVDGSVHQVWDASRDDGATWGNFFDGIYKRP